MKSEKEIVAGALKSLGAKRTDVQQLLDLTDEELELVELRVALVHRIKKVRSERGLTQAQLAELLGSSQPSIARIESGDGGVTVDLMIRALLAMGAGLSQIRLAVSAAERRRATRSPGGDRPDAKSTRAAKHGPRGTGSR